MDKIDELLRYIHRTNPEMTREKLINELTWYLFSNAVIIFHHNLSICVGLPSSEPRRPVRS